MLHTTTPPSALRKMVFLLPSTKLGIHASCCVLMFFGDGECFRDKHFVKSSQFISVGSVAPADFVTAWKGADTGWHWGNGCYGDVHLDRGTQASVEMLERLCHELGFLWERLQFIRWCHDRSGPRNKHFLQEHEELSETMSDEDLLALPDTVALCCAVEPM